MRAVGACTDGRITNLKGIVTVGAPFDVLATGVRMRHSYFGLLDWINSKNLSDPFKDKCYALQKSDCCADLNKLCNEGNFCRSVLGFDNQIRSKYLGYASGHHLYRNISSDRFIPAICTPFMVVASMDDPVAFYSDMPRTELLKNPYCTLVEAEFGGHGDFITGPGYKRHWLDLMMTYFEDL